MYAAMTEVGDPLAAVLRHLTMRAARAAAGAR